MSPMIFVHGWGQSSKAWHYQQEFSPELGINPRKINLPGHGGAPASEDWLAYLLEQLGDEPAILIGWSLGGMLLQQLLLQSPELQQRTRGLVLIGSTPKFVKSDDWDAGTDAQLLHGFHDMLNSDKQGDAATLMSRFFSLMLQYPCIERAQMRELSRIAVDKQNPPQRDMLKQGLHLLETLDLRSQLNALKLPTLVIHGTADAIVPFSAAKYLAEHLSDCTFCPLQDAGHAPFLTHASEFNPILESWCQSR